MYKSFRWLHCDHIFLHFFFDRSVYDFIDGCPGCVCKGGNATMQIRSHAHYKFTAVWFLGFNAAFFTTCEVIIYCSLKILTNLVYDLCSNPSLKGAEIL